MAPYFCVVDFPTLLLARSGTVCPYDRLQGKSSSGFGKFTAEPRLDYCSKVGM